MKTFLYSLVLMSSLSLMTACDVSSHSQTDDHLALILNNSLIIDSGDYTSQFLNILDEIKNDPSNQDYINGMIDDFLRRSNYPDNTINSILTQINLSSTTASKMIDPHLAGPLKTLFTTRMPVYLKNVRKESYSQIDTTKLEKIEKLFIALNGDGSTTRFTDKESVNKILKATTQLNFLLK